MKKLAFLLLFGFLLLSCSGSDDDDTPLKPQNVSFTYSVDGLISFTKGDTQHKIPLFTSVSYKDASGNMVTETITTPQWEKKITVKNDKAFPSKIVLKYNRVENADDERVSVTRKNVITYLLEDKLSKVVDISSTMTMTTKQLNSSLENRGDYELEYEVPLN